VISLDWTLILQFVNFMVLLVILNKLLYRPLLGILEQRRDTIEGAHDKAQSLQSEIEEKMARYQAQLNDAKAAASTERANLKKAAQAEESTILGEAQQKATVRLQAIKDQVAGEASEAGKVLKTEAESLAGQIATKVLGRDLA
jgi:F-type H+-transporting ATPase subunit b